MTSSLEAPLTDTQRYWLAHLRACDASGQTMRDYAESRGLAVQSLYSWKQQLRKRGVLSPAATGSGGSSPTLSFQRLAVVSPASDTHCRIELPNGVVVNWPVGADSRALGAIVGVLLR